MQRQDLACEAIKRHKISKRRAEAIFKTSRKRIGVNKSANHDEKIIKDFALKYPHYGYRMIAAKLRLEGYVFNHKKVYRICKSLNLNLGKKRKSRKLPARKKILEIANNSNQIWSLDFMSGRTVNSSKFRTLNIIDEWAREALTIEVLKSIPSKKVIDVLDRVISARKAKPIALRSDNGSEFTSFEFVNWAKNKDIRLFYIQAGKPYQNCYIERFNGTYRREVLNRYIFEDLNEVRQITDDWLDEYNYKRPHSSLNNLPPKIFLNQF